MTFEGGPTGKQQAAQAATWASPQRGSGSKQPPKKTRKRAPAEPAATQADAPMAAASSAPSGTIASWYAPDVCAGLWVAGSQIWGCCSGLQRTYDDLSLRPNLTSAVSRWLIAATGKLSAPCGLLVCTPRPRVLCNAGCRRQAAPKVLHQWLRGEAGAVQRGCASPRVRASRERWRKPSAFSHPCRLVSS